jgi:peptidyl-prolyl isomerase E (cyclophilin E)
MQEGVTSVLLVSDLVEVVDTETLFHAFVPFGEIAELKLLPTKGKRLALVEFEFIEDAEQAVLNMDGAELFGSPIRVEHASSTEIPGEDDPIWKNADSYYSMTQQSLP